MSVWDRLFLAVKRRGPWKQMANLTKTNIQYITDNGRCHQLMWPQMYNFISWMTIQRRIYATQKKWWVVYLVDACAFLLCVRTPQHEDHTTQVLVEPSDDSICELFPAWNPCRKRFKKVTKHPGTSKSIKGFDNGFMWFSCLKVAKLSCAVNVFHF